MLRKMKSVGLESSVVSYLSRHRTMWKDPIVEETRRRRDELARRFDYDIKAIGEALRGQCREGGQNSITRPRKRVEPSSG